MTSALLIGAVLVAQALGSGPGQAPVRPRITGIAHVALRVSDAAAARTFYTDLLGLTPRQSRGARTSYAIGARQSIVVQEGLRADEDERLLHVAFETTDVAALTTYFEARGVQVESTDQCQDRAIRVVDPDGHTIEFVQVAWPPAPAPAAPGDALSNRLLHAGLIIGNETRAHAFYRDTLGFLEIWRGGRPEGVTRWVNMRVPEGTEYLEYMLVTAPPDRRARGVLHHLCLRVPDMQEAWEEVARRTARLRQALPGPPQIGVNGRYQLNLFDADGTRVELMEPFTVR